jgi:hypothetical protein
VLPYIAFKAVDLTHVVGLNDSHNCKLNYEHGECNDNQLVTSCEAMLQGFDRLDRFFKWSDYLRTQIYHGEMIHNAVYVKDIGHDPLAMLQRPEVQRLLFDMGEQ